MKLQCIILAMAVLFSAAPAYAKHHHHHHHHHRHAHHARHAFKRHAVAVQREKSVAGYQGTLVAHPTGCPARAFCGCGAAVKIFGAPIRALWLAANWFKFPRSEPAPGRAAVRRHHVFVLESHIGGSVWQVYDANSGHHATRIHARSIAGYTIVDPQG